MEPSSFNYGVIDNGEQESVLLEKIFRLRYQVYAAEWGFEDPADHPLGLETDVYDSSAVHIYAYSGPRENIVGTARIILNSSEGFPLEKHFDITEQPANMRREKTGEISRLSISKLYRRREIDKIIFGRGRNDLSKLEKQNLADRAIVDERRKCEHELIQGIYLLIYKKSLSLGLTHWYAVMAKGLKTMLARWGIPFHQIGPEKEYHGLRAPYALNISELERHVMEKNPDLFKLAQEKITGK